MNPANARSKLFYRTNRVSFRILFGDTDICDFEILYDRLVNAEAVFTGENEPYCRSCGRHRLAISPARLADILATVL
jgi:hypothetical protein